MLSHGQGEAVFPERADAFVQGTEQQPIGRGNLPHRWATRLESLGIVSTETYTESGVSLRNCRSITVLPHPLGPIRATKGLPLTFLTRSKRNFFLGNRSASSLANLSNERIRFMSIHPHILARRKLRGTEPKLCFEARCA